MNIDKNIPMPVKREKSADLKIVLQQMDIGDSVLLHGYKSRSAAVMACTSTAYRLGMPFKFISAVEGDGIRVWRKA